jgi:UPF0755 protein
VIVEMFERKNNTLQPLRPPLRKGGARCLGLLITLCGIAAVSAVFYFYFLAPASWTHHVRVIVIPAGKSFQEAARILEETGVVRDRRAFTLLARFQGAVSKVKAGEYEVHTSMTPRDVLSKLVRGEVIQYPITVPEGYNFYQIADLLEQTKVCSRKLFLEKAQDPVLISALELEGDSLEGYLFPDTYNFPKGLGEEQVIRQMVARFKAVYASLSKKSEQMGISRKNVVILASMIEKEAMDDQERRLIAAVFHNRLNQKMALQSDPTAIYGIADRKSPNGKITRDDLSRNTPYNTYLVAGLPRGPISNPGLKSLEAVLYPASVPYLYFVSKNDGTHYFSSTLEEHNRAVARYQRRAKK